jgi:hypothetical protein
MSSTWRKSSYSNQSGGSCVEVATVDVVIIRDTTDRDGFMLSVPAGAWTAFVGTLR